MGDGDWTLEHNSSISQRAYGAPFSFFSHVESSACVLQVWATSPGPLIWAGVFTDFPKMPSDLPDKALLRSEIVMTFGASR